MTHRRAPLRELRRVGNLSLGHFVSSETSFCIWYFAWWLWKVFFFFFFVYLRFNDLYHFSQKPSTTATTCETWEQSELNKSFANCFHLNCAEIVTFLSLITSAFHPDVIGLLFRFNVRSRQSICRIYRGNLRERDREREGDRLISLCVIRICSS